MKEERRRNRKRLLIFLLVVVPALLILAWSQASLNLSPLRPTSANETILLLALSSLIFLALVIFGLILARILLKLYVERRQHQLGSRFKTKLVVAFLALSLVPVCFLFAFAYGLLNRSIDKWFGMPFDTVRRDADGIVKAFDEVSEQRTRHDAADLASDPALREALLKGDQRAVEARFADEVAARELVAAVYFDANGRALARAGEPFPDSPLLAEEFPPLAIGQSPQASVYRRLDTGDGEFRLAAQTLPWAGKPAGTVVVVRRSRYAIRQMAEQIRQEAAKYDQITRERKAVRVAYLSWLLLVTLVILFIATWFADFMAKQVTVPVQSLAEATEEVSKGNLAFRIHARSDDELGTLIQSFNEMTRQLQENRLALVRAAEELKTANRQLEEHSRTMEAILSNIPTGVLSFDPEGRLLQINATGERLLGEKARSARVLADLFAPGDAREVARLLRRASRQGTFTRQMELELGGRKAAVALTVTSIRAGERAVGTLMVLEDLTDLVRAQRAAAWSEVAQRIAHEIKNPLTPIQLSSERIGRLIERMGSAPGVGSELAGRVSESAALIGREVATLKTLVDEFSDFARFPGSKLVPSNLNVIVENALNVFDGRLAGIEVHRELAPGLPAVQADPEQMKRAIINLVDNAAEALDGAPRKMIWVRTALDAQREVVQLAVADSGPGIPPEAAEKLFLPYFSTKRRGTGLGLAIVSRIISEHEGTIRAEENRPTGALFVIELPVERTGV
ncbi:MAG: hypothetical protein DMG21_14460 [Acidobacteria bacterium]|nr:MAG: hypothetical protein DMG21_14460 [Acidobacteriota bacterium]